MKPDNALAMNRLLNSAMMPIPGTYTMSPISLADFVRRLNTEAFASYIGYPQNAEFLRSAGVTVPIPISREQTALEDGDTLLVMRLRYRVTAGSTKGQCVSPEDFEFFEVSYKEPFWSRAVA